MKLPPFMAMQAVKVINEESAEAGAVGVVVGYDMDEGKATVRLDSDNREAVFGFEEIQGL